MSDEDTKDCTRLPVVAALNDVQFVCDTFKKDLEQGYTTKDKVFAVDLLERGIANANAALTDAQALIAEKDAELERLRMQLAACGVVAMANTPESAVKCRDMHPDYMSASCQDVMRAVDSEMALRAQLEQLQAAPAERGAIVLPEALSRAFITSESVDGNYRVVIKSATLQETQQVHNWLARLNPAPATAVYACPRCGTGMEVDPSAKPATADSDVREVSE